MKNTYQLNKSFVSNFSKICKTVIVLLFCLSLKSCFFNDFYDDKLQRDPIIINNITYRVPGLADFIFDQIIHLDKKDFAENKFRILNTSPNDFINVKFELEVFSSKAGQKTKLLNLPYEISNIKSGDLSSTNGLPNTFTEKLITESISVNIVKLETRDSISSLSTKEIFENELLKVILTQHVNKDLQQNINFVKNSLAITNKTSFEFKPLIFLIESKLNSELNTPKDLFFYDDYSSLPSLKTSEPILFNTTISNPLNSTNVHFRIISTGNADHKFSGYYRGDYRYVFSEKEIKPVLIDQIEILTDHKGKSTISLNNSREINRIEGYISENNIFNGVGYKIGAATNNITGINIRYSSPTGLEGILLIPSINQVDTLYFNTTKINPN